MDIDFVYKMTEMFGNAYLLCVQNDRRLKTQNRLIRLILPVLLYSSQNIWLNLVEPTIT